VQGILQRTEGDKPSQIVLKSLHGTKKPELQGNVREYVLKGSTIMTDKHRSYDGLESDYDRKVIDHAVCYAQGHVHTNGLENFWSLLKRALKGTYVNVEPFHLFRYLDEQAFRFNNRKDEDGDRGRFMNVMSKLTGKRLTYKKLIDLDGKDGGCLPPETTGTWQTA
jgi:transposase-like protein